MLGTIAELFLVEHTEDLLQLVPLIVLGLGAVLLVVQWRWPTLPGRQGLTTLMAVIVASGALGLWLHYRANAEFELEMYPSLSGLPLFWKAIHGASPPSLAPGAMFVVGLLGMIWTTMGDDA